MMAERYTDHIAECQQESLFCYVPLEEQQHLVPRGPWTVWPQVPGPPAVSGLASISWSGSYALSDRSCLLAVSCTTAPASFGLVTVTDERLATGLVFTFNLQLQAEFIVVPCRLVSWGEGQLGTSSTFCLQQWGLAISVWRAMNSLDNILRSSGFPGSPLANSSMRCNHSWPWMFHFMVKGIQLRL